MGGKKSILFIFGGEKASGAEVVILRLMENISKNNDVTLFIAPGDFANKLQHRNTEFNTIIVPHLKKLNRSNQGRITFYIRALINFLVVSTKVLLYSSKKKIDIIHANTIVPASYLIPAIIFSKIFLSKKWVWSDHDLKYYTSIDEKFSKLCVKFFDHTFAVSKAVKNKYGSKTKVSVLYNGLDQNYFISDETLRLKFRNNHNIKKEDLVIGLAAVLAPRKGQVLLMEAFNSISQANPNVRLFIAGNKGEDDLEYIDEIFELISRNKNIEYLGKIDDIVQFYNGCDIIINNSSALGSEPLGTTIYEAMACEKLVLGTNTGGTTEIIENNVNGFVFEPDKRDVLEKLLLYTTENYSQFNEMRIEARKTVLKKFSIESMAKRYTDVITKHM